MVTYDSEGIYIDSKATTAGKLLAVKSIISALLTLAASEASNDGVSKYTLNDGQVIIITERRGMTSIMDSIKKFETLQVYYENKLNGSRVRLVPSRNFTGPRNG